MHQNKNDAADCFKCFSASQHLVSMREEGGGGGGLVAAWVRRPGRLMCVQCILLLLNMAAAMVASNDPKGHFAKTGVQ